MSNLNTIGVSFSSNTKDIVEQLESEMQSFGIHVHRYDKEIYARDDIFEYMNFLINLNVVVLIIDDSYFESLFCLYELAKLIDMPEKLLLVYKGENFESLNLKVKEFKLVHEQLQDNTAMKWLIAELSKYNFDEIFNKVSDLFRKKYLTPEGLFNNQGKKYILQMLHFTPTLYWEKLNLILCRKTFMEREEGFEAYLEYGVANDVFYYQKALSYEKEEFWSGVGYYLQKAIDYNPAAISAYVKLCELIITNKLEVDYIERNIKNWELISEKDVEDEIKAYHYQARGLYYFKKGIDRKDENLLKIADENFDTSLKYQKENAAIYNNKGHIYEIKGDIIQSAVCYQKAIELKPNYYQAYNNLALLFLKYLHDEETAVLCFKKALSIQEDYEYAMNGLAIATEKSNVIDAFKRYLEIVCINLKSTDPITNMALILEEEMQNIELAGIFYEILYKTHKNSVPIMFNYANYLRRYKKDFAESERLLVYVKKFMPKSDIVMMTFALLYFQRGDYNLCKKEIEDLIQLFPEYASALFLKEIIDYFIDCNNNEKMFEEMQKISGCSNREGMIQYIESIYLKQSNDRIHKNRVTKFITDDNDFLILKQIKNNMKKLLNDIE